jgi:hypothetical protein
MVKKFDKIYALGKIELPADIGPVYAEEKLDGANFRVWFQDGVLRFGTRQTEFPADTVGFGAFQRAVDYVRGLNMAPFVETGYMFYFEAMHKHTIDYDWGRTPPAVLIDVFDVANAQYLCPADKLRFATTIGCDVPQLVYEGPLREFYKVDIPKSAYYKGEAEGIVIKPFVTQWDVHGNIVRAKLVSDAFKEENHLTFHGTPAGTDPDKNEAFIKKYATDARLEKMFLRCENVPKASIFKMLSGIVLHDIASENVKELIKMGNPNFERMTKHVDAAVRLFLQRKGIL